KARDNVAEIVFIKLRIFADFSRKEASTQRTKWNEPYPEFLQYREHLRFGLSPPQRVFALQRGDGLNFVRTANSLHACFGESEVLHLAFLNQLLHGSGDVFDRNVRIHAVLVEQ